jgi:hypothetical protein
MIGLGGSSSGRKQLENILEHLANPDKAREIVDNLDRARDGHKQAAEEHK